MISIAYQDLILTVIALAIVAVAITAAWFARRASRTLARYEQLAITAEAVALRTDGILAQLDGVADELRMMAGRALSSDGNGAGGVDATLALVRQFSALGSGLKSAFETFQTTRRPRAPRG